MRIDGRVGIISYALNIRYIISTLKNYEEDRGRFVVDDHHNIISFCDFH